VAIYVDTGAEADKIVAMFRAVAALGHEPLGVGREDIRRGRLVTGGFDLLIIPAGEGGSENGYAASSGLGMPSVLEEIEGFVRGGGGLVAVEAGAFFVSSNGGGPGLYAGAYEPTHPTPGGYTFTVVDPLFGPAPQEAYMSAGGGYFSSVPAGATVVAVDPAGRPAAVRDTCGSGRVVLSAFSPELRGDSELDWTLWDNLEMGGDHADSEGAWRLLGRMIGWAGAGDGAEPTVSTSSPGGARVAVVATHTSQGGAWPGLLPAVVRSIEYAGHLPLIIRFDEVRDGHLTSAGFDVVVFPGGYAYGYRVGLAGYEERVREFVSEGGGYYGICAGSFYASDAVVWEGETYDYPLNLYPGQAVGPIEGIARWPTYTLTPVYIDDPVVGRLGVQQQMYYGGGYHTLPPGEMEGGRVYTVGTYTRAGPDSGRSAIVRYVYGDGRVLLVGTHPECRSGTGEDWLYWDDWAAGADVPLTNPDNPWTFVDAAFDDWLVSSAP